ncbi:hypothetical protein J6590_021447 [Homalodisca vitripennis]|nr:hypothetical protein J6590_021447 [Homalodisca vitripennis]
MDDVGFQLVCWCVCVAGVGGGGNMNEPTGRKLSARLAEVQVTVNTPRVNPALSYANVWPDTVL